TARQLRFLSVFFGPQHPRARLRMDSSLEPSSLTLPPYRKRGIASARLGTFPLRPPRPLSGSNALACGCRQCSAARLGAAVEGCQGAVDGLQLSCETRLFLLKETESGL